MKKKSVVFIFMVIMAFTALPIGGANAIVIDYQAIDLVDEVAGEDLWQYSYSVSDHTFAVDTGFTIYFDYALYGAIDPLTSSPNADWDVLTWDPDSNIPDYGAFDAYALTDSASLSDPFTVSFIWLGAGTPGAQYYELYDQNFLTIDSNNTMAGTAPVPEPATLMLLGAGLVGMAGFYKRRKA